MALWSLLPRYDQAQQTTLCYYLVMLLSLTHSMFQPKFDSVALFAFIVFSTFSSTYVFNDTSIGQAILVNLRAFYAAIFFLLLLKTIDVIVTLLGERDFFKSGHLDFVHNLKEGLIIVNDRLKSIRLINVAAR